MSMNIHATITPEVSVKKLALKES